MFAPKHTLAPLLTLALVPFACDTPEDLDDLELAELEYDDQDIGDDWSDDEGATDGAPLDNLDELAASEPTDDPVAASPGLPGFPAPLPLPWPPVSEEWVLGDSVVTREWNSGKTTSLSSWKELDCTDDFGTDYLLTDLRAYREPASNWDRFTARLRGTCTLYENDNEEFVQTGTNETEEIYSANHRSTQYTTAITASAEYPAGVWLENAAGDNYVQKFRIIKVSEQVGGFLGSYSNPLLTASVPTLTPVGSYLGPMHDVQCPDQYVMTGLKLRYDTRNGKIRRVKINCQSLSWE